MITMNFLTVSSLNVFGAALWRRSLDTTQQVNESPGSVRSLERNGRFDVHRRHCLTTETESVKYLRLIEPRSWLSRSLELDPEKIGSSSSSHRCYDELAEVTCCSTTRFSPSLIRIVSKTLLWLDFYTVKHHRRNNNPTETFHNSCQMKEIFFPEEVSTSK